MNEAKLQHDYLQRSQYQHNHDDEIDIRDLVIALLDGWKILVASVAVTITLALAYLFFSPVSYTTELAFTPTPDGLRNYNNVQGINYSEANATAELAQQLSAWENFYRFLESSETGKAVLREAETGTSEGDPLSFARRAFNNRFSFSSLTDNNPSYSIRYQYQQKASGPELINAYFAWTLAEYTHALTKRADRAIDSAVQQNERQMQALLEAYQEATQSRILRLTEADQIRLSQLHDRLEAEKNALVASRQERIRLLSQAEQIAEQLNINRPTTPRELGRQQDERDVIYAEINSQNALPLYFMGTEALRTERLVLERNLHEEAKTAEIRAIEKEIEQLQQNREIEAILAREQEHPFIGSYHDLQEQNLMLQASRITPEDIQVATVTLWGYQPDTSDSPRRSLTLALALIGGAMLGVILIALARLASSIRQHRSQAS